MGTAILEAAILASALSVDAFLASFVYGSGRIRMRLPAVVIISLVSSGMLGVSLGVGGLLKPCLPARLSALLSFLILFLLGTEKILDQMIKSAIRKWGSRPQNIRFSLFHLKFILSVYADPENADVDSSKTISPAEACSLAAALSLDGMAAGLGAALGDVNGLLVFAASFVTNAAAVVFGERAGMRLAGKTRLNLTWLPGAVLIALAFLKLF